jgi:hypothetical protein
MITGYYDWNESIAYPLVDTVDTSIAGVSLSGLIVGASFSLSADVADVVGTTFYVASVLRDRANSAVITVAPLPVLPEDPVFVFEFRVPAGTERFAVIPGVIRGSLSGARGAAFLVVANTAFVSSIPVGAVVTFSGVPEFDPGVVRVSDRGNVSKITVLKSTKRADVPLPYIDNAPGASTPITLDQINGAPSVSTQLVASGVQYKLVSSSGTTFVAMPTAAVISSSLQTPMYTSSVRPVVEIGKTDNSNTKAVVGVPVDFKFTSWINNPSIYGVITFATVYVGGVKTSIGGPDGIPKASLAAGFSYTFAAPGTYLVSVAAEREKITGLTRGSVSFITFSVTVVVTASAAYTQPQNVPVNTATGAVASVPVADYQLSQQSLVVQKVTVTRTPLPPIVVNAVLGGAYDIEDEASRNDIAAETLTLLTTTVTPVFVAGKNVVFTFSPTRNAVALGLKAGAHITVPYIGYAVPATVSCSGAVRTLFGASADADGNVNIIAGAGVTVIPEPAAHRITVIIEDPRNSQSGKTC